MSDHDAVRLADGDIEAIALRVAELLREQVPIGLVDARDLALMLGVERGWVYARSRQLGGVRLGDGPKAPLRFDLDRVRAVLAAPYEGQAPPVEPVRRRGRPRRSVTPPVKPVRERPTR